MVKLPGTGWNVIAGLPEAEVLAPARALLARSIVIGIVLLLLVVALTWWLARGIARPIRDLAQTAMAIAGGNSSARARIDGPAEVAAVAQEFNNMHDARKRAEEQALQMAQHDPLTGLPNRALFTDRLQRDLASARRDQTSLALLFIDLDKFKPANDQFGHPMGDLLLQAVAQRMQACVRDSDTLARIGGDEFMVLLRAVAGEPEALTVAEKIRVGLEQPFVLAGHSLGIGCCVGVALYPQHGDDDLTLSRNADQAMYQAKERGRNQVVLFQATPEREADLA